MTGDSFNKVKFYQRQLIVNRQVQTGIIGYSVFLVLAVFIGQYLLQTFVFNEEATETGFSTVHVLIYGIIFVFFVAVILYGMYLSNQIAGPIHRMKVHLEDIKAGKEVPALSFRKSDYFQEILQPYNDVVKKK